MQELTRRFLDTSLLYAWCIHPPNLITCPSNPVLLAAEKQKRKKQRMNPKPHCIFCYRCFPTYHYCPYPCFFRLYNPWDKDSLLCLKNVTSELLIAMNNGYYSTSSCFPKSESQWISKRKCEEWQGQWMNIRCLQGASCCLTGLRQLVSFEVLGFEDHSARKKMNIQSVF